MLNGLFVLFSLNVCFQSVNIDKHFLDNNFFLVPLPQDSVPLLLKNNLIIFPLPPATFMFCKNQSHTDLYYLGISLNQGIKLAQVNLEIEISRRVHSPLIVPLSFRFSPGGRNYGSPVRPLYMKHLFASKSHVH